MLSNPELRRFGFSSKKGLDFPNNGIAARQFARVPAIVGFEIAHRFLEEKEMLLSDRHAIPTGVILSSQRDERWHVALELTNHAERVNVTDSVVWIGGVLA